MFALNLRRLSPAAGIALAAMSPAAHADPVVGGFADAYSWNGGAPVSQAVYSTNSNPASAGANLGPGASITSQSETSAWINRIGISGDSSQGTQFGSALSLFAINQVVTGTPGGIAHLTYSFGLDGSFQPGNPKHFPTISPGANIPPQNITYYLGAYLGTAQGMTPVTDAFGTDLIFNASNGSLTLQRITGAPGFLNTIAPYNITTTVGCSVFEAPCVNGGVFNSTPTIQFDIPVGQDFYVAGYLTGATNGALDFMHTAKLLSVSVTPGFNLVSDDGGALKRAGDGIYRLAGAVPEPATWGMMVLGFGMLGGVMRRQRSKAKVAAAT